MRRKVASNLLWMLSERGLQVVAGIGIVAMLARGLGPEGFAHFQYAQAIVTIAASVALICGGEVIVPRLVGLSSTLEQHRLLAHAFALRAAGAVLGYGLMCAYLLAAAPVAETWEAALLLGIAILLREPAGVVIAWMQAHTHNRPGTVFSLIALTVKLGLAGLVFALGLSSVPAFAAAIAVEPVILATLLGAYYFARVQHRRVPFDRALASELVRGGALFWVSFMMMMGARRVDQLILQPSVSLAEFSAYAASMQILDNFTVVAAIVAAGVAPAYVYSKSDTAAARASVIRIALGMTAIGAAGAAMIALASPWIVHLLYGAQFAMAIELLRFAALASALIFADVGLTLLPVYLRRPDWIALKWALVLATTLAFDLWAVPRHGAWGAIGGYALANAVAVLFGMGLCWRSRRSPRAVTA
jgi:PST family polysaccharide transporter